MLTSHSLKQLLYGVMSEYKSSFEFICPIEREEEENRLLDLFRASVPTINDILIFPINGLISHCPNEVPAFEELSNEKRDDALAKSMLVPVTESGRVKHGVMESILTVFWSPPKRSRIDEKNSPDANQPGNPRYAKPG